MSADALLADAEQAILDGLYAEALYTVRAARAALLPSPPATTGCDACAGTGDIGQAGSPTRCPACQASGGGEDQDTLRHQRDLLGQMLGKVLVTAGVVSDQPLTGPQLLLMAEDYLAAAADGAL